MQEKILTPDQVAQILQVHPFTVLKFIKQGKLIASKLGRVYRIRESDLEGFLDNTSGKAPKNSDETPNIIKKSKNKNKFPKIQEIDPSSTAAAQTDPKVSDAEITVAKVEIIESEQGTAKKGGDDQYYVLQ